jgi:homoserine dehydrogenase
MIKNKKLNIAIVGLGNIGLNLYEHLIKYKKTIKEKTNINLEVKYVSAKSRFKKEELKYLKKNG